ncbi:MAG: putative serine protease PepD [Cryptosporangiaceae bacterium]|jgi:putative serine protease PepD|nr:putative serine protease PepD [Cryptosporangiaceae bacterium]
MTENLSSGPAPQARHSSTGTTPESSVADSGELPGSVATHDQPDMPSGQGGGFPGESAPRYTPPQHSAPETGTDSWSRPTAALPAAPEVASAPPAQQPVNPWAQTSAPPAASHPGPYGTGAPQTPQYGQPAATQAQPGAGQTQAHPWASAYGTPPPPPPSQHGPWQPGSDPNRPRGRGKLAGGIAVGALAVALVAGGTGAAATMWATKDGTSAPVITRDTTPVAQSKGTAGTAEAAADTISKSTVTLLVTGSDAQTGRSAQDTGSGVVLRDDGYIITNNHVIAAAASGGTVSVQLPDGTSRPATITGADQSNDIAVVKLKDSSGLKAATFGDSSSLKLGQPVLAMGAPLGLTGTVTEGIVSAVNRPVRTGDGSGVDAVIDAIQTDAAINPGNSGGPLVDLSGRVVGINSAIATVSGASAQGGGQSGNIGVGFAIPANDAIKIAQQLISKGSAQHATLGVSAQTADDGSGAVVAQIQPGQPAAAAGLKNGDEITKVGDRTVVDVDSLIAAIRDHDPGSKVQITYKRGGQVQTVTVTLVGAN